jgi:hypothetical protein
MCDPLDLMFYTSEEDDNPCNNNKATTNTTTKIRSSLEETQETKHELVKKPPPFSISGLYDLKQKLRSLQRNIDKLRDSKKGFYPTENISIQQYE